jgi:hypothetical protein
MLLFIQEGYNSIKKIYESKNYLTTNPNSSSSIWLKPKTHLVYDFSSLTILVL